MVFHKYAHSVIAFGYRRPSWPIMILRFSFGLSEGKRRIQLNYKVNFLQAYTVRQISLSISYTQSYLCYSLQQFPIIFAWHYHIPFYSIFLNQIHVSSVPDKSIWKYFLYYVLYVANIWKFVWVVNSKIISVRFLSSSITEQFRP